MKKNSLLCAIIWGIMATTLPAQTCEEGLYSSGRFCTEAYDCGRKSRTNDSVFQ